MKDAVSIIVGSVLGATEYVADAVKEYLDEQDYESTIYLEPNVNDIERDSTWLICTSTHGAGDFPDNIQPFVDQISELQLPNTKAAIIGLGDSSYDTFCNAASNMEQILVNSGAQVIHPIFTIDVLQHPIPEEIAVEWVKQRF